MKSPVVRFLLPLFILLLGVATLALQVVTRPRPQRAAAKEKPTAVEVVQVERTTRPALVRTTGTVNPAQEVVLGAEVTGRVVWIHPELVAGGEVAAEETLVKLDARQYRLAAQQLDASRERAEFELKVEKGRRRVAEREWKLIGSADTSADGQSLALREPHLRAAQASLRGAQSALERARLDLTRTKVKAPFNAVVREESVDVGQLVTIGGRIATLVGCDAFWVQASLSLADLSLVQVGKDGQPGSVARIIQAVGDGAPVVREGRVIRLLKDLDPRGRMARVVIEVKDPLATDERRPLPLLLGAFVTVEIDGRTFQDAVALPRLGLRQGDEAWVMNAKNELEVRPLRISWRGTDSVMVTSDLAAGDKVVVSRITAPVAGMALRDASASNGTSENGAAHLENGR